VIVPFSGQFTERLKFAAANREGAHETRRSRA